MPKTTEAIHARDAPANRPAMPTIAAIRKSTPPPGNNQRTACPNTTPSPPPMVSSGASVPPDVPLPSEMHHERNFIEHKKAAAPRATSPESNCEILS